MSNKPVSFPTAKGEVAHFLAMVHPTTPPHLLPTIHQAFVGGMLAVVSKLASLNGDPQRPEKWKLYAASICDESYKASAFKELADEDNDLARN